MTVKERDYLIEKVTILRDEMDEKYDALSKNQYHELMVALRRIEGVLNGHTGPERRATI